MKVSVASLGPPWFFPYARKKMEMKEMFGCRSTNSIVPPLTTGSDATTAGYRPSSSKPHLGNAAVIKVGDRLHKKGKEKLLLH